MFTTEQQDFYDQNGYLMVENVITKDQLNKLQAITYEFIEASRNIKENDTSGCALPTKNPWGKT